jgi:hypothetical protein
MTITLEQFQKAVAERRGKRKHGARRYESELVLFALAHAETVMQDGRSLHAAAKDLGVTMSTLQSWQQREAGSGGETSHLREVVVSDSAASLSVTSPAEDASLTLTTRSGHVVRGLNTAQIIALLRVLP